MRLIGVGDRRCIAWVCFVRFRTALDLGHRTGYGVGREG